MCSFYSSDSDPQLSLLLLSSICAGMGGGQGWVVDVQAPLLASTQVSNAPAVCTAGC